MVNSRFSPSRKEPKNISHGRIYTGERPFKCDMGMMFVRKSLNT